jgi:hypothetical protein
MQDEKRGRRDAKIYFATPARTWLSGLACVGTSRVPPLRPEASHTSLSLLLLVDEMLGPLGPSFAAQIRSSKSLHAWLKPVATWYANVAGYRQMGLKYDDLCALLLLLRQAMLQTDFLYHFFSGRGE